MVEKDKIFSSKYKYNGALQFADFYRFCYDWLVDDTGLLLSEDKYTEKLSGDSKNIEIEWNGYKNLTDYFRFEAKVTFRVIGMVKVEVTEGNKKIKADKGAVEITIKSTLARDYKGKFEKTGMQKFLRAIYEKWVIPARIEQFEGKIIEDSIEFLEQGKSYLDMEGKRL